MWGQEPWFALFDNMEENAMSMFQSVKKRALGFMSGAWTEGGQRRDRLPSNRRSRFLSLESLENRKLLSVSPSAPPNADLADFAEPTAMVATADSAQGADTAAVDFLAELDSSAEPTGSAPTVTDDIFSMTASQQLGAGVLANDTTGGGDELVVSLQTDASHGRLSLAANGLFTYRPDAGFGGTDTFTYVVSDGTHEAGPATVTIEVLAISNLGPQAADDAYSLGEDQPLVVGSTDGVLGNDNDLDGDPLAAVLVNAPGHGTLTLGEDGSFEYTPEADFHGEDSFSYVASDGQTESAVATVAITVEAVNDAPASVEDGYSVAEDGALTVDSVGGVLANDSDIDGDPLAVTLVDGPSHGTVTLSEDGAFEYTPKADFHGEDSFSYVADDGQAESAVATVAITVEAVNNAPQAVDDSYSMTGDAVLTVDVTSGVLANDADADGDTLTVSLIDGPSHGTVTLGEDGSFAYTPQVGFAGEDSFSYVNSDGQAESGVAIVTVDVTRSQLSVQLQVSATPFGANTEGALAGSTFWVSALVEDLREDPSGVVGGAIDLIYDAQTVVPTGEVVYGEAFDLFRQGEVNAAEGIVDEAGALAAAEMVGAGDAAPFVSWQFERTGDPASFATASVQFSVDASEGTSTIQPGNFALTGSGTPVDWSDVEMGSAGVDLIFADFNGDHRVDHFDLALWLPHSGSAEYDPMFDLDSSGLIDQADLDLLVSGMYGSTRPSNALV